MKPITKNSFKDSSSFQVGDILFIQDINAVYLLIKINKNSFKFRKASKREKRILNFTKEYAHELLKDPDVIYIKKKEK